MNDTEEAINQSFAECQVLADKVAETKQVDLVPRHKGGDKELEKEKEDLAENLEKFVCFIHFKGKC